MDLSVFFPEKGRTAQKQPNSLPSYPQAPSPAHLCPPTPPPTPSLPRRRRGAARSGCGKPAGGGERAGAKRGKPRLEGKRRPGPAGRRRPAMEARVRWPGQGAPAAGDQAQAAAAGRGAVEQPRRGRGACATAARCLGLAAGEGQAW